MIIFLIMIGIVVALLLVWLVKKDVLILAAFWAALIIVVLVAIYTLLAEYATSKTNLVHWQQKREALVYQMDHNLYLGDALGEFNSEVMRKRILHESPWTSWFEGDYIMQIEPIDVGKGE